LKKLFIDLDVCGSTENEGKCTAECSYPFHPGNDGVISLLELAAYAVVCRQCESGNCVESCPKDALEKEDSGAPRVTRPGVSTVREDGIAALITLGFTRVAARNEVDKILSGAEKPPDVGEIVRRALGGAR
jgi:hypothetical protein